MEERRKTARHRALRGGKIIFNDRRSVIDCLIRNMSRSGASLQVESTVDIPDQFGLLIDGEDTTRSCHAVWSSDSRIGVEFADAGLNAVGNLPEHAIIPPPRPATEEAEAASDAARGDLVRLHLLTLRAALDEIEVGVVLLDAETRAQFINRAFRRMWRLSDDKADSRPPFVALMYHGRDTRAYAVAADKLDAYVAERVALIKAGEPRPLDLRLANGEIIRLTCTVLPAGGRMLCYTYVTDLVRASDEMRALHGALDNVEQGIVLMDSLLNVQFINTAARKMWNVTDAEVARRVPYIEMVSNAVKAGAYKVPSETAGRFVSERIAVVRAGDPAPVDIPLSSGRTVRAQCATLPGGGRMLTYTDVTDLVARADTFARLAATDGMTGLYNRREFDELAAAEWDRFQRYHRPLSLMMVDIDRFKEVNDSFGHASGDRAISHVAALCSEEKRTSDIVARFGGDEFAVLLPETDQQQAQMFAERLRDKIARIPVAIGGKATANVTVSIGLAQATAGMSGADALCRVADAALYKAKALGRNCVVAGAAPSGANYHAAAE